MELLWGEVMIVNPLRPGYRGRLILWIDGIYITQYGVEDLPQAYERIEKARRKKKAPLEYSITRADGGIYDRGEL